MTLAYVTRGAEAENLEWIDGGVLRVLLDGEATDGRLTAMRSQSPGGAGAPVHVHARDDETVFILSGEVTFWAGRECWSLGAGDVAFLPRGLPHTYTVTSDTSEMLLVCAPSGLEAFFRTAGWDPTRPKPEGWVLDMATLEAAAAATGQTILGGPLEPGDRIPDRLLTPADLEPAPTQRA